MFGLNKRVRALEYYLGVRYTNPRYKDDDGEYIAEEGYGKMFDINKVLEDKRKKDKLIIK